MDNNAATPVVVNAKGYRNQAVKVLQNEFRSLSCQAIKLLLEHNNFDFTSTYNVLATIRADDVATAERIPAFQHQPRLKIFIKVDRKAKDVAITNRDLQDEVGRLPALNKKKSVDDEATAVVDIVELLDDDDEDDSAGDENGKKENHQEVECGCCYGDYPPQDMDECSALVGHRCCKGCVRRYATEQLDGNNSTNFCCIVDSDCDGVYRISQLDTLLTPKINRRINDRYIRAQIEACGLSSW